MAGSGEGMNKEFQEVFDSLVADLGDDLGDELLSLQLTDFEDINHLHGTEGCCSADMEAADDFSEDSVLKSVEYNGQKYIFMRAVADETQSALVFISVDGGERGRKRGMLFMPFCDILRLVATFDYQAANSVAAKVFRVLEQYSCEDEQ